jgi:AcrR family transcriptional regulator
MKTAYLPHTTPAARKGARTREVILATAVNLASRLGLEGLSIGTLADELRLSKSGLFAHFRSKEQLQYEVLSTARTLFIALVAAPALKAPRGEPRVRALFERWLDWSQADFMQGGCLFVTASIEFDDRPGVLRDFLVESQREWLATLARAARVAVEEGHFRPGLDPEQFAHEMYGAGLAYYHATRLLRDPKAPLRGRQSLENLIAQARA